MRRLQSIAAFLASVGISLVATLAAILAVFLLWTSSELNAPQELAELIAVLGIAMGAVIVAASVTAIIHRLLDGPSSTATPGVVFRESIKRYAWLAAPIAGGYGVAQIVARVAEIIAQAP